MCAADLPPLNTTGKKTLRCCLQVQSAGALMGINVLHLPPRLPISSCCHTSSPTYLQMAPLADTVHTPALHKNIHTYKNTSHVNDGSPFRRGAETSIW